MAGQAKPLPFVGRFPIKFLPASPTVKLKTSDVPQADSLTLVRRVLEAIAVSPSLAVKDLAERTEFSARHVRYRIQAARILGFVDPEGEPKLTPRAKRLLATTVGSPDERNQLMKAINNSEPVRILAPGLLASSEVDVKKLAVRIGRLSGLSPATAERRAVVLRSWHRELHESDGEETQTDA